MASIHTHTLQPPRSLLLCCHIEPADTQWQQQAVTHNGQQQVATCTSGQLHVVPARSLCEGQATKQSILHARGTITSCCTRSTSQLHVLMELDGLMPTVGPCPSGVFTSQLLPTPGHLCPLQHTQETVTLPSSPPRSLEVYDVTVLHHVRLALLPVPPSSLHLSHALAGR